jgi:malate dehydrogenase (oxaloacetate-decarboxylating)(NADP+)
LACLDILVSLGLKREKVTLVDIDGVVYEGRKVGMNPFKDAYARKTDMRTLDEAVKGADFFLGLSGPGVLKPEMVAKMAKDPIIFALANPTPEILPEEVRSVSPNAVIATGRSDYPNQVNNVLCFPYIFRGALDVGATTINEEMKLACVKAIADLTMSESSDVVAKAYSGENLRFGADYILPKPFDPRLIVEVATAVARAAMETGVATRPIADFEAYRTHLNQFVFRSGLVMRPVVEKAKKDPKRLVFAEGEDERVLRAAQQLADEGIAKPILLGRIDAIERRIASLGLRIKIGEQVEAVEIGRDPRFHHYADHYRRLMQRRGVTPDYAANVVVTRNTVVAALMVKRGEADAMICGTAGRYARQLEHVVNVLGMKPGATVAAAMNLLILPKGTFFLTDTYVNPEPTSEQLAEITLMAAEEVRRFGIVPKVALLSHSNFGSSDTASARRMRAALPLIEALDPDLEVEGEMHADSALSEAIRSRIFPASRLRGQANLMVLPTQDAANIAFNMLKVLGDGISVGPILLGVARAAHILTPSVTVRGLVNMGALAVVDAQLHDTKPTERKK